MVLSVFGIANRAISVINPHRRAKLRRAAGYTIAADGTQIPRYDEIGDLLVNVQSLSTTDLMKADGLNLQGNKNSVYLQGNWNGIIRADQTGGDILILDGYEWLVALVLESWPEWTKVLVTQQTTKPINF
jgi:hypothetical protein